MKAVVQVAGLHSLVRIDPNNESRRAWFRKVSLSAVLETLPLVIAQLRSPQSNQIYVPANHPVLDDDRTRKRLGDQVFTSGKPADTLGLCADILWNRSRSRQGGLVEVLPQIQAFVASKLDAPPVQSLLNGNGHIIGIEESSTISAVPA